MKQEVGSYETPNLLADLICKHFDLGVLGFHKCEKQIFIVYRPPSL